MRAVRYHEHGGTDVLRVDEIDRPSAGPGEVVVEVAGAGVNPVDTYFREGAYTPFTLPMIPGGDFAGEVVEVGEGVEGLAVGDVAYGTGLGKDHLGPCAEYAVAPTDRTVPLPDGVDPVAAGGAGTAAVTAYRALVDHARLAPGETALIHGGSGGVGHAAVQLAAAMGANVVTTAAPTYHDRLVDFGADAVLDYDRDDLEDAVLDAAGGEVEVILDHRLDDYFEFDVSVAATGGRMVGIGENVPEVGTTAPAIARLKDFHATFMSMFNTPDLTVPLERVARLMADGDIEIAVARAYDLDEVPEAHRAVMEDSFLGKLVVTP
ncbi:MAG: NADPH:quinone reductase [Halobacteriota archaeon]